MSTYAIAGGWRYRPMRVGVLLLAPDGDEAFFQPGDAASHLLDTIDAVQEIEDPERAAMVAAMVFGDYFP